MQDLSSQQAQGRAMSSAGSASTSRSAVQMRAHLRGLDFAAGSAMLAPGAGEGRRCPRGDASRRRHGRGRSRRHGPHGGGQTVGMAMTFAGSADYAEWTKPDPLKKSLKQQGFIHNAAKSGAKSAITQLTAAQIDGLNLKLPIGPQVTALLEKTEHAAQAAAIAQVIESKLQAVVDRKYQVMIEYAPKQAGYIAAWEAREIAAAEAAAKAKGVTKDEATDATTTDEATTDATDANDIGPHTLYTVKTQEGLFGITKALGLTCHWQDVARVNGINPDKPELVVGQTLKILDSWQPQ